MQKNFILGIVLVLIVGTIAYLEAGRAAPPPPPADNEVAFATTTAAVGAASSTPDRTPDAPVPPKKYPRAQELVSPDAYINTGGQPITLSSLVGSKVVLIDFWTYSCINCQRTLPYLNAWYQKYKDYGLEIIGVHSPEFDFEKVLANVQMGVDKFGIKYPVVLDSEMRTWAAYQNMYWPEHYLMDIGGYIVDRHIGEGGYAETEAKIQQLLRERAKVLGLNITIPGGTVDISQSVEAQSPETYFGAGRNQYLGNGTPGAAGPQTLAAPDAPALNTLYLSGTWNFAQEYAENTSDDAHIIYTYDARSVYFVASAPAGASIRVMRDGVPIGAERGADVAADGTAHIQEARLYKLIEEPAPGRHTLEIIIPKAGLQAFTFTFG